MTITKALSSKSILRVLTIIFILFFPSFAFSDWVVLHLIYLSYYGTFRYSAIFYTIDPTIIWILTFLIISLVVFSPTQRIIFISTIVSLFSCLLSPSNTHSHTISYSSSIKFSLAWVEALLHFNHLPSIKCLHLPLFLHLFEQLT